MARTLWIDTQSSIEIVRQVKVIDRTISVQHPPSFNLCSTKYQIPNCFRSQSECFVCLLHDFRAFVLFQTKKDQIDHFISNKRTQLAVNKTSIHSTGYVSRWASLVRLKTQKTWRWRDTMNKTCIHWFALIMRPVIRSSPHGIAKRWRKDATKQTQIHLHAKTNEFSVFFAGKLIILNGRGGYGCTAARDKVRRLWCN